MWCRVHGHRDGDVAARAFRVGTAIVLPPPSSSTLNLQTTSAILPLYPVAVADSLLQATGFALPLVLLHSGIIYPGACWMAISGGLLVYGTILVYSGWFGSGSDDDEF